MLLHAAAEKARFTGDPDSRADLDRYVELSTYLEKPDTTEWENIRRDYGLLYSPLLMALVAYYKNTLENELMDGCPALWYTNLAVLTLKLAESFSPAYRDHLALTFGSWMEYYRVSP